MAFQSAQRRRKRLTSVDKSNVLEVSQLWREVVTRVGQQYPDVELSHMCAHMQHVARASTGRNLRCCTSYTSRPVRALYCSSTCCVEAWAVEAG